MASSFRRNVSRADAKRALAGTTNAAAAAPVAATKGRRGECFAATADVASPSPTSCGGKTAADSAQGPGAEDAAAQTLPPGARFSAHNGQLLVSTGVASLDELLGGGLRVGAVMLLLEDRRTAYARLLLSYFLSQGLSLGHSLCLASVDDPPELVLRNMPWRADDPSAALPQADNGEPQQGQESVDDDDNRNVEHDEKMTIAWRYQRLQKVEAGGRPKTGGHVDRYCDVFDLTRRVDQETLGAATVHLLDVTSWAESGEKDPWARLLLEIARVIAKEARQRYSHSTVLRIAVQGLLSPAWPPAGKRGLFKFLHGLRGLLRQSQPTACLLTIPAYTFEEDPIGESILRQALHCVDASLRLKSFAGHAEIAHPSYASSYHGLVDVLKLPRMSSLLSSGAKLAGFGSSGSSAGLGARDNLAFRLRRRRFVLETFHLPPEGGVGPRSTPGTPAGVARKATAGVLKKSASFTSDGAGAAVAVEREGTGQTNEGCSPKATRKKAVAFADVSSGCGSFGNRDTDLEF